MDSGFEDQDVSGEVRKKTKKKAYRKRAKLQYHVLPKPNNPEAAEVFSQLSKLLVILANIGNRLDKLRLENYRIILKSAVKFSGKERDPKRMKQDIEAELNKKKQLKLLIKKYVLLLAIVRARINVLRKQREPEKKTTETTSNTSPPA